MSQNRLSGHWLIVIAISTAIIASWIAFRYAKQPLLEAHGFRQTQTALTSYWMIHEGWQLDYQTPVAGYPWSIPFEFPLFQSLVALISQIGGFHLDPVGRLVSFGFLIACAWPAFKITRQLGIPSDAAWVFCALLWSSPIYLFWGRTFMIETAATFFTLMGIHFGIDLFDSRPRWRSALFFAFWITLGLLQKITTAAPIIIIVCLIMLFKYLKTFGLKFPSWRYILIILAAFVIPVFIAGLWAYYTDAIKQQNPLGISLTSTTPRITKWTFGTFEQRMDFNVLKTIFWDRVFRSNAGGILGVIVLLGVFLFGEKHIKTTVFVCLTFFIAPIAFFTNLHFIHDYYQASSTLYLIGALAISVVHLFPRITTRSLIVPFITLIFVVCNLFYFSKGYAQNLRLSLSDSTILKIGNVIRRYTPTESGIVVFGADWSSEIAYYSERKSFTVPEFFDNYDDVWNNPSPYLGDKMLSAVVYCIRANSRYGLTEILESPVVKYQPQIFKIDNCYLWLPEADSITLPGSAQKILPLGFFAKAIDIKDQLSFFNQPVPCIGSLDNVNGKVQPTSTVVVNDILFANGWMAVDPATGTLPDMVYLVLTDEDGNQLYIETQRVPRKDVEIFFNQTNMINAGYEVIYDVASLQGNYNLSLARLYNGVVKFCSQQTIPLKINIEE